MDVQLAVKSYNAATQRVELYGGLTLNGTLIATGYVGTAAVAPVYGPAIAIDASAGGLFIITPTDAVAFAIGAPTGGIAGQEIKIQVVNSTGGAIGAGTFNAIYKMVSNTLAVIANGKNRTVTFVFNGVNWIEVNYAADVPN